MPTMKGPTATSRPGSSSARTNVMSRAMNLSAGGCISRQGSTDSVGSVGRRKSVGPSAVTKKPSSATNRRSSSAASLNPRPSSATAKDRVTVAVRKRPASGYEIDVVNCPDLTTIQVSEPRKKVDLKEYTERHQFTFDYAFDEQSDNDFVYRCTAAPLVPFVLQGGLATCFAFGQTGSGKTFTMLGSPENQIPGLYLLASKDVFRMVDDLPEDLDIFVSMMEIYGDDVFDLLSETKQKLIPREDAKKKVQIQGLTECPVRCHEDMMEAIECGSMQRCTSVTGMNEQSSRSHAILQIQVRTLQGKLHGQLSFIDLAGSEKGSDTAENVKKTRLEGAEINKSLLALKECIRAMNDPTASYTPFRSSKLTQVLKESFIGNGRTVMIANISPSNTSCLETVNTLRYADRVKAIGKAPAGAAGVPKASKLDCSLSDRSYAAERSYAADRSISDRSYGTERSYADQSMDDGGKSNKSIRRGVAPAPVGKENRSRAAPSTRRQSHLADDRYTRVLDTSVDDMEEDMRTCCEVTAAQSHKRRRSPTGAPAVAPHMPSSFLGGADREPSFNDEHDDDGFVFHGVQNETIHEDGSPEKSHDAPDPVLFVNSFRHQIERSMQLIEQEVAMLDTLERGGSNPLTKANVAAVQSLLMERISMSSKLQAELQSYNMSSK